MILRRALLVFSKLNNWAFYIDGEKEFLRLLDNDTDFFACGQLLAEVKDRIVRIQIRNNDVFSDTKIKISFSGDFVIVWDG